MEWGFFIIYESVSFFFFFTSLFLTKMISFLGGISICAALGFLFAGVFFYFLISISSLDRLYMGWSWARRMYEKEGRGGGATRVNVVFDTFRDYVIPRIYCYWGVGEFLVDPCLFFFFAQHE